MNYSSIFQAAQWDHLSLSIYSKTKHDVERALVKPKRNIDDFMALISPSAEDYIEDMAQRAALATRRRFGNTVGMFIPLYLSNLCANECTYCGFSMSNKLKRKTLTKQEVKRECQAIIEMGFDSILLVTGEHENKVGMEYFADVLPVITQFFSYVMMEVQPLSEVDYTMLRTLGVNSILVYQETYHPVSYARYHTRGKKRDFNYRLDTPDRIARAGHDKIGVGALLGLEDWRVDSVCVAQHLMYLRKHYWRTRFSVSFPRLRPCAGSVDPVSVMSDKQLLQLICTYRLWDQELELSLSTRESAYLRDNIVPFGITSLSAGSQTQPGGYAQASDHLEQFSIDDNRDPQKVSQMLLSKGLQPVWKDWDPAFSGESGQLFNV